MIEWGLAFHPLVILGAAYIAGAIGQIILVVRAKR